MEPWAAIGGICLIGTTCYVAESILSAQGKAQHAHAVGIAGIAGSIAICLRLLGELLRLVRTLG